MIPSKPGSIIPYSNQLTRAFLMAQVCLGPRESFGQVQTLVKPQDMALSDTLPFQRPANPIC